MVVRDYPETILWSTVTIVFSNKSPESTSISKLFPGLAAVGGGEGFHQAQVENQFTANAILLSVGPIKSAVAGLTAPQDVWWPNFPSQLNKLYKEELFELSKLYSKVSWWISITDKSMCHLDMPVRQMQGQRWRRSSLYWDIPYLGKSRSSFQMQSMIPHSPILHWRGRISSQEFKSPSYQISETTSISSRL